MPEPVVMDGAPRAPGGSNVQLILNATVLAIEPGVLSLFCSAHAEEESGIEPKTTWERQHPCKRLGRPSSSESAQNKRRAQRSDQTTARPTPGIREPVHHARGLIIAA